MALPEFSLRQLLEAGAHFGHRTQRWNPKMAPYLFGVRNDIHIIDLTQTVPLFHQALLAMRDTVAGGGRVLFVGTKRQGMFEETLTSAHTSGLTKKELLQIMRERDKLERALGGIKEMGGLPSMLFVIDTNKEAIAVAEARKLEIPVAAKHVIHDVPPGGDGAPASPA